MKTAEFSKKGRENKKSFLRKLWVYKSVKLLLRKSEVVLYTLKFVLHTSEVKLAYHFAFTRNLTIRRITSLTM